MSTPGPASSSRVDRHLHPRPGAAPLPRQVLAQARMETRLLLRNGEQLLLAVVIPVHRARRRRGSPRGTSAWTFTARAVDALTPGVLALAVMSTGFTSLAIATGFERRYGVLKRLGSSPLPRSGLLLGKVGALLLVELFQVVVIGAVALVLGWSPRSPRRAGRRGRLPSLLGTAAFASLGLLVAGALRAEATLAAANLVYLLLMAGGAVVFPTDDLRRRAATAGDCCPPARWASAMRDSLHRRRAARRPAGGAGGLERRRHGADREDVHVGVTRAPGGNIL